MSRFFVGQRVRLARPHFPENLGLTGLISSFAFHPKGAITADLGVLPWDCDCTVTWDGEVRASAQLISQLEPILPDGHRACDDEFKRDLDKLLEGLPA